MGNMGYIILASLIIVFGVATFNFFRLSGEAADNSSDFYEYAAAKNLARSSLNYTLLQLSDDPDLSGTIPGKNKFFYGGTDTVSITPMGGDSIRVSVTAWVGSYSHTLTADLSVTTETTGSLPLMMTYAMLSDGNLHLHQNFNMYDDGNGLNANIHSNGNLHVKNGIIIKGFGTHSGNFSGKSSNFVPNENPNNDPTVSKVDAVEVPVFKADDHIFMANKVTNDNLDLSGKITLGTEKNPVFWYVSGNLTIKGDVSGYGAFIVKGNIHIDGNISITVPDAKSTIGLYTEGNVHVKDQAVVEAQIFSAGNVHFHGSASLYGNIVSDGNIHFHQTTNFYFRPANSILTTPVWTSSNGGNGGNDGNGGSGKGKISVFSVFE